MKIRKLCLLLCLTVLLSSGTKSWAAEDKAATLAEVGEPYLVIVETGAEMEEPVLSEDASFYVDDVAVSDPGAAIYNNTTYVSLRDVVMALRPDATVSWEGNRAVVSASGLMISVRPGDCYIVANGRYLYVPGGVKSSGGYTQVPVRTVAQAMGATVSWDAASGSVRIHKGTGAIVPADAYYHSDDLYWLSHIINAESGNQPLEGKLAVGTVILNRVKSTQFPNTIYDVVFDRTGSTWQFSPVGNGAINKEPNNESVLAAKLCLEGAQVGGNSMYFVNPRVSPGSWAQRNRPYVMTIGSHSFFG